MGYNKTCGGGSEQLQESGAGLGRQAPGWSQMKLGVHPGTKSRGRFPDMQGGAVAECLLTSACCLLKKHQDLKIGARGRNAKCIAIANLVKLSGELL